jgi:5'-nucleotidase
MRKILVSNDDGVFAPGIVALAKAMKTIGDVTVIAPDRNRSGASNALTLDRPVEVHTLENGFISLNGTPTDCVHMGVSGLFCERPDIVVSGINNGANLGDDVLYSGTVAAAMEGRTLDMSAIAVSLASFTPKHFETAAEIVKTIVENLDTLNLPPRTVLNVNVPDVPLNEIKGIHLTRLGHRAAAGVPEAATDPRGKIRYWVAGAGDAIDKEAGTDFYAVEQGYVSITPLHIDMTSYAVMDQMGDWLERLV